MTNAKVYQGFHDDKDFEEHWCRWNSRYKFRSTFHTQAGWPYWHVIFPVFCLWSLVSVCCSG